jgi:tetratricopeptide (TPR) repeat protein
LIEGRRADALKAARKVAALAFENACGPNAAVEAPRFRHLPWMTSVKFGQWDDVLSVPQPPATNDFLIDRAMWHFTRGVAFAAKGKAESAMSEHEQMLKLIRSDEVKKLDNPQFPATGILAVAEHWLAASVAGARGDSAAMIEQFEKAVAAEDSLPYMEPAYWPLPVRPALGAALLKTGDAERAEQVFRDDLQRWPRNGWSLFGLEQSLRRQGKDQSADMVHRQFEEAWERADVRLDLAMF